MKKIFRALAISMAILVMGTGSASASTLYRAYVTVTPTQDLYLFPGDRIISQNSQYMLLMQQDGNLVVYRESDNKVIWNTGTQNQGGAYALMKKDHSFGIFTAGGSRIWSNDVVDNQFDASTSLLMRDDGRIQINGVRSDGLTGRVWYTGRDNGFPGCASGPATAHPVCFYKMNIVLPACSVADATSFAVQNGGNYGACP